MAAKIEKVTTKGIFSLDGEDHEVENNVYVVGDSDEVIVIDAAHDAEAILAAVGEREILAVVCTHGHNDHVNVAFEVAAAGADLDGEDEDDDEVADERSDGADGATTGSAATADAKASSADADSDAEEADAGSDDADGEQDSDGDAEDDAEDDAEEEDGDEDEDDEDYIDVAPVALHRGDRRLWQLEHGIRKPDIWIEDGGRFEVGGTTLEILHTPGHSPGSICLYAADLKVVFSGDTLFKGGPGATGRSYSDFPTILGSISDRLLELPPRTRVLPGHGEETTIGAEAKDYDEWVERGH